jgi:hypothetical protein
MHDQVDQSDGQTCRYSTGAGGNEHSAAGTERNHDEHHFKPFEKNRLEGGERCDISQRAVAGSREALLGE